MKNFLKFIIFLIYVTSIFLIQNKLSALIFLIINLSLMLFLNVNIKKILSGMKGFIIVILITAIINMIMINFEFGLHIGIKLLLVYHATCIFSQKITYMELSEAIEKLFYPIKWIGSKPKDISLIVCIALSFIPILKDEIYQIRDALKCKGYKFNIKNIKLLFKPFFISLLKRVNDIEDSLKSKAYQ